MKLLCLFFNQERTLLGEGIFPASRSMDALHITAAGETFFGRSIEEWKIHGILMFREKVALQEIDESFIFYQERVRMDDPGFMHALQQWLEDRGGRVVCLDLAKIDCWKYVQRLPLDAQERYTMLIGLRNVESKQIPVWQKALERVDAAVVQSRDAI